MDKAVEAVVAAVKEASPLLWAAAQTKVAANVAVTQFWINTTNALLLFFGLTFVLAIVVGLRKQTSYGVSDVCAGVGTLSAIGVFIVALMNVTYRADLLALQSAPQWAAIQEIAKLAVR